MDLLSLCHITFLNLLDNRNAVIKSVNNRKIYLFGKLGSVKTSKGISDLLFLQWFIRNVLDWKMIMMVFTTHVAKKCGMSFK